MERAKDNLDRKGPSRVKGIVDAIFGAVIAAVAIVPSVFAMAEAVRRLKGNSINHPSGHEKDYDLWNIGAALLSWSIVSTAVNLAIVLAYFGIQEPTEALCVFRCPSFYLSTCTPFVCLLSRQSSRMHRLRLRSHSRSPRYLMRWREGRSRVLARSCCIW